MNYFVSCKIPDHHLEVQCPEYKFEGWVPLWDYWYRLLSALEAQG
jgi:hypothetical protein